MMTKAMKQISLFCVAFAVLVGLIWGTYMGQTPITYLRNTVLDAGVVYGLDCTGESFRFFKSDEHGTVIESFTMPVMVEDLSYQYDDLVQDGGGVFVLGRTSHVGTGDILEEAFYWCDFDQGTLVEYYTLPVNVPTQYTNLATTIHSGTVYTFQSDYTGKEATTTLYQGVVGQELEAVTAFSYDIGIGFTDFYVSPSGTVLYTTPAGALYVLDDTGNAQLRYPLEGQEPLAQFITNNGETVLITDAQGIFYTLNLAGDQVATPCFKVSTEGLPVVEFAASSFDDTGRLLLSSNRSVVTIYELETGQETWFDALQQSTNAQVLWGVLAGVIALCGCVGIYLLVLLFNKIFRGKTPIVTKLLAVFLPILIISLGLMNSKITSIFTQQLVDNHFEQLFLLTSQYTATLNTTAIETMDMDNVHDSVYFYQIRSALNVLPDYGELFDENWTVKGVSNASYFWLYRLEDGTLTSLVCEQDYVNVPVELRYPADVAALYYQAVENGITMRTTTHDSYGDWSLLLTPIYNTDGEVVGLLEAGDEATSINYAVEQGAKQVSTIIFGVLLGLAVILSGVIAYSLYPLKSLTDKVAEIADGKLGVQTTVRGRDEVAEISRVFNTMSHNVEHRDKEIRATSDGYARFVPAEMFQLLDKTSVIDVRLADQTSVDATVLSCGVSSFDALSRTMGAKEMFLLINQVLERMVPTIEGSGGLVDSFDRAGLLAIYTSKAVGAPDSAIALLRTMRTAQIGDGVAMDFHGVISAGPAMIGIVGAQKRLEAMTISEHTNFTKFLRPLAISHGADILVTASAAERIEGFDTRYHSRILGYVRMETLGQVQRIYDIFDGSDEQTFALKGETKATFEQGVALYCAKDFVEARLLFIQVLKIHRNDLAAQRYLYRCDQAIHTPNADQDVCIATY